MQTLQAQLDRLNREVKMQEQMIKDLKACQEDLAKEISKLQDRIQTSLEQCPDK